MQTMKQNSTKGPISRKTGELMVDEGLVHRDDINRVVAIQKKNKASLSRNKSRLFGMILCDLNLITPIDNYCVLKNYGKLMTIQAFLVQKKIASQSVVEKIQAKSIELDIPFMSLLLEDDILPKTQLQQIVFDLFHIPFRSISDIVFDEKTKTSLSFIIKKHKAQEHKVIPLALKDNTLLCGITDPENLVFIKALNQDFPQYRFKTLFIPFSGFTWFYKMLYEEAWASGKDLKKPVDLSLLLNFFVTITDPVKDKNIILSLYKRYELVRSLINGPPQGDRTEMFQTFIKEKHEKIKQEYQCSSIEFLLKMEQNKLRIMAFPKRQAE
jgi:hypothetical protein